jgi:hypothetical protein
MNVIISTSLPSTSRASTLVSVGRHMVANTPTMFDASIVAADAPACSAAAPANDSVLIWNYRG